MWQASEVDAMASGVSLADYWGDFTPKLLDKYIEAYNKRLTDQAEMLDLTNFMLGQYIGASVAEVLSGKKSYPAKPRLPDILAKRNQPQVRQLSRHEIETYLARERAKRKPNDPKSKH